MLSDAAIEAFVAAALAERDEQIAALQAKCDALAGALDGVVPYLETMLVDDDPDDESVGCTWDEENKSHTIPIDFTMGQIRRARAALAEHRAAGLTKALYNVLPQAALAAQRAMGLVVVPVDMWKLEAVKDAYAQFLADAGLKNAPSLEHLLPRLIAAAQGKADA